MGRTSRKVGVLSKLSQVDLQARDLQEGLGGDETTILEWILKSNWVDSAQGKNYWRAFVNAALNLRVP